MLAQTEWLCATIWLAYHPVGTALRGTHEVSRQVPRVGIADIKGQSDVSWRSLRAVKKHDIRGKNRNDPPAGSGAARPQGDLVINEIKQVLGSFLEEIQLEEVRIGRSLFFAHFFEKPVFFSRFLSLS